MDFVALKPRAQARQKKNQGKISLIQMVSEPSNNIIDTSINILSHKTQGNVRELIVTFNHGLVGAVDNDRAAIESDGQQRNPTKARYSDFEACCLASRDSHVAFIEDTIGVGGSPDD